MAEGIATLDVPATTAYDYAKLDLPVWLVDVRGQEDRIISTRDGGGHFCEDIGIAFGGALVHHLFRPAPQLLAREPLRSDAHIDAYLGNVFAVVGPGAEDLSG